MPLGRTANALMLSARPVSVSWAPGSEVVNRLSYRLATSNNQDLERMFLTFSFMIIYVDWDYLPV